MLLRMTYLFFSLFPTCYSFITDKNRCYRRQNLSIAMSKNQVKRALYPFQEARKIARNYGFESKEEFLEYSCPGAYQLPKNPDEVWENEWLGWENFLGICYNFEEGRTIARKLKLKNKEEYIKLFDDKIICDDDPASRLPYKPDLKYKAEGWLGWDDWLLQKEN